MKCPEELVNAATVNINNIAKALREAKIPTDGFVDSDAEQTLFTLRLSYERKHLTLSLEMDYEGSALDGADYTRELPAVSLVDVSRDFRQAVIRVKEKVRTVQRIVSGRYHSQPSRADVIRLFPITLPPGTKYTVEKLGGAPDGPNYGGVLYRYKVSAKVPASDLHFLVGFDEHHMFVSMLPKKADSVEAAHAILTPSEVVGKKGVLRQGEFYFIPATDRELGLLGDGYNMTVAYELEKDDGEPSDHSVSVGTYRSGKCLVSGWVTNERHRTLLLNGWYRVVQNNELQNPSDENLWD